MQKDSRELRAVIEAAQRGDEQAFEKLLGYLEQPVWRLALHLTGQREDAEDAVQETLIKLWRSLPFYRFECPILPYVLRITRHVVIDRRRHDARREQSTVSLTVQNEQGEYVEQDVADPDDNANPALAYEREQRILAVHRAIDELSEEFREVLILKELQNASYEQIGQILGLQEGTVKSRLFRARKKLAEILKARNIF